MKKLWGEALSNLDVKSLAAKRAKIYGGIFAATLVGANLPGTFSDKLQDVNYLHNTVNNRYSTALPTDADMSSFDAMKSFISRQNVGGKIAADVSPDVARSLGPFANWYGRNLKPGERAVFSFNDYAGQEFAGRRARGEVGVPTPEEVSRAKSAVASKIGSINDVGGGARLANVKSSVVERLPDGSLALYGWDTYDFDRSHVTPYTGQNLDEAGKAKLGGFFQASKLRAAERGLVNNSAFFGAGGFGPNIFKGTQFYDEIKSRGGFQGGFGLNRINKDILFDLQEFGSKAGTMGKPTTVWAAKFNSTGGWAGPGNQWITEATSFRNASIVTTAIKNNLIHGAAGVEVGIGLGGVLAAARRRRKKASNPAEQETTPIGQIEPPTDPAELPVRANEIIPETKVENVVQEMQPTTVKRYKKVRDEEALQRRQSEIAARQHRAEQARLRRDRVRAARNSVERGSLVPEGPSIQERLAAWKYFTGITPPIDPYPTHSILPVEPEIIEPPKLPISIDSDKAPNQYLFKNRKTLRKEKEKALVAAKIATKREQARTADKAGRKAKVKAAREKVSRLPRGEDPLITKARQRAAIVTLNKEAAKAIRADKALYGIDMDMSTGPRPVGDDALEVFESPIKQAKKVQQAQQAVETQHVRQATSSATKEVVDVVETVKQTKAASRAAAQATDHVTAKSAAKAAQEGVEKIAQKAKTTLSGAGLAGVGAVGLFALLALGRKERNSEIAPRRRQGRVVENPRYDADGMGSFVAPSAAMGAISAAIGIKKFKLPTRSAGILGILTTAAFMAAGGIASKKDTSVAVLSATVAGAAGLAAYGLLTSPSSKGVSALSSFFSKHGKEAAKHAGTATVGKHAKLFPGIARLVPAELLEMTGGILTVPVVHSVAVKAMAARNRMGTDHASFGLMSSWQYNNSGSTDGRLSHAPLFGHNSSNLASVNFSGSLRTHYDTGKLFSEV